MTALALLTTMALAFTGDDVARRFEAFLARRRPLPPGHGLALDTRQLPWPAGLPSAAVHYSAPSQGKVWWSVALRSGVLEVELERLGDAPPQAPVPRWSARLVPWRAGPEGLGEFAMQDEAVSPGAIGWLRGDVRAAVRFARGPTGQPPEPSLESLARAVDGWLSGLPVVKLTDRWARAPTFEPADPVVGETLWVRWEPPLDTQRFEVQGLPSAAPSGSPLRADAEGLLEVSATLIDRVTLQSDRVSAAVRVRRFEELVAGLSPERLAARLDPKRLELSWQLVERLLALQAEGVAVARTVGWWESHHDRVQQVIAAAWATAEGRRALLTLPDAESRLPLWVDLLARSERPVEGTRDADGDERQRRVARVVVAELMDAGRAEVAARLAFTLRPAIVSGAWMSFASAFHALGDHAGARRAIARVSAELDPGNPDWALWRSNLAVEQSLAGSPAAAEATLDEVLHRRWRLGPAALAAPMEELGRRAEAGDARAGRAHALRLYLGMARYNRACVRALQGKVEGAVADLLEARRLNPAGYPGPKLAAERDFGSLRGTPGFEALLE